MQAFTGMLKDRIELVHLRLGGEKVSVKGAKGKQASKVVKKEKGKAKPEKTPAAPSSKLVGKKRKRSASESVSESESDESFEAKVDENKRGVRSGRQLRSKIRNN